MVFFLLIILTLIYFFWEEVMIVLFFIAVMPISDFSISEIPDPYNYEKKSSWLIKEINSDKTEKVTLFKKNSYYDDPISVFFIHPTTYFGRNWNQPLNDSKSMRLLEKRIVPNQVNAFSLCCDIYVPKYRQATIFAFVASESNSRQAFEVAYSDVRNAFSQFFEQVGDKNPFIIASHSQGSMHAVRLLRDFGRDKRFRMNFVTGYLIGYDITDGQISPYKVCEKETDIRCIVGWNTAERSKFKIFDNPDMICVNPLSWRRNEDYASKSLNLGSMGFPGWIGINLLGQPSVFDIEKKLTGAKCLNGVLEVDKIDSRNYPVTLFSYHAYDYGLFHKNISKNATIRIQNFRSKAIE